ncbi:aspartate aminotransferase family protein [Nocardioides sp. L-11A]|uniref:aspartate aminotransferase family protein n=1 Tax=Nocardioides sp. L-11A TaxID=3043848 RepID=UPI00249C9D1F|nr:aspartate aminotransferase family protein [Nocardioides sp. L-11A]
MSGLQTARATGRGLAERARRVVPGGVNSGQRQIPGLEDLVVVGTSGARFTDADGREYVDFHAAFGPPLLGLNDPDVNAAVARSLKVMGHTGVGINALEVELAERIVDLVPSVEKVLLTTTGSEATFHALRLARAATGRKRIVKFQGCFHGWHDSVAMNVATPSDSIGSKHRLSSGMLDEAVELTTVLPFNDVDALEQEFAARGDEVAAVILEPIQHNIGAVLPKLEFLQRLRELCDRFSTVLIFDEVITGFRHGLDGYQGVVSIRPDLTTFGKSMGNGYPIAALGGRADLMDMFSSSPGKPVFFAGTYNGHPATVSAALATIDKLCNEPVYDHIFRLGAQIRLGLEELYRALEIDAVVSGFGSVFITYFLRPPVHCYEHLLANDEELFTGYRRELLNHGVFELPLNLKRSHVSYAHQEEDVHRLLDATERAVRTVVARRV